MQKMLRSSLGRLRLIGMAEGISLLVLFGIAMPLKYMADKPEAVRVIGWIHGLLFVLFMIAVIIVYDQRNWPFKKVIYAFIASFLPFVTFVFDAQLKKE
jgi:integral membrane protein